MKGKGRETTVEATPSQGIVIAPGGDEARPPPRIRAFIWGGKVRPAPTLPFGRWKGAA